MYVWFLIILETKIINGFHGFRVYRRDGEDPFQQWNSRTSLPMRIMEPFLRGADPMG